MHNGKPEIVFIKEEVTKRPVHGKAVRVRIHTHDGSVSGSIQQVYKVISYFSL